MNGFVVFARKEVREFLRGWRAWVLFGVLAMFALTGPLTARYVREILGAAMGDQTAGIPLPAIPDPTYVDAYLQWTKNLGDLTLFLVIVLLAGVVCGECRQGTAVLVLTKTLPRRSFVLAKAAAHMGMLAVAVSVGTVVTWGVTRLLFPVAPPGPLVAAVAAWLLLGTLFVAIIVLASACVSSTGAAAGIGLAAYLLLTLGGLWAPLKRFTPVGLRELPAALVAGRPVDAAGPVLATVVAVVVLLLVAVAVFERREL